jgi:hypothetical protein
MGLIKSINYEGRGYNKKKLKIKSIAFKRLYDLKQFVSKVGA